MNKLIRSTLVLACLSLVLVVVVACVPPPTPVPPTATPSNTITDIVWQWTSVTNKPTGETTTVAKPQDYTITFRTDGTLSGKADCNTFTGTYSQASGFSITIGATTMAACAEGSLGQQYLELLSAVVAADRRPRQPGAGECRRREAHAVQERRRSARAIRAIK